MSVSLEVLGISTVNDANPRYCPIGVPTLLLQNTAEQIDHARDVVQSKSSNSLTFALDLSDRFIGRDMYIKWDTIPLKVTRTTDASAAFTGFDFHDKFFGNYSNLCMKQFGLLNAINSITVNVDGKTITTKRGSELMEIISHFYSKEEVHRHFQASNPNASYSNLVPDTAHWIPSVTTSDVKVAIKGSALSENDPFSPAASDGYNSRIPVFTMTTLPAQGQTNIPATTRTIGVNLHNQVTWLPFNILGINGDTSPLYGANQMTIQIELHTNWPNRIFSTKKVAGTSGLTLASPFKFELNREAWSVNSVGDISIHYKKFLAPQYISNTMNQKTDKWIQDYTIVELDERTQEIEFKDGKTKENIASTPFYLNAIPKKLYIALVNKRDTDDELLTDATHFCRFDELEVDLMGAKTSMGLGNGANELYLISKQNGLEMTETQALYTMGFPVCLDVSNDLGCRTNSFIGLSTADTSGKVTIRIRGVATRLHHDTEAADFTLADETKFYKRADKKYYLRLVVVYAGFFACNLNGARFSVIESLSVDGLANVDSHVQNLMKSFAPKMNTLGGAGWLSSLMPTLKNVGQGVYNVIKAAVSNKDGLRDSLAKAYKGGAFDAHAPVLGAGLGMTQHNVTGGRAINGWESY